MSKKKAAVPDAWDDDWEEQADKIDLEFQPDTDVKLTRAERKAKHEEANKQLWEAAETTEKPLFLAARDSVPMKTDFKPTMRVLSRKMASTNFEDEETSDEERRRKAAQEFTERQARARKDREEKQRKYQEVRDRLFGGSNSAVAQDHGHSPSANELRTQDADTISGRVREKTDADVPATSSIEYSSARSGASKKHLFEPGYAAKPNSTYLQRRANECVASTLVGDASGSAIRAPRGPVTSGRGGFGFAPRGNKGDSNS